MAHLPWGDCTVGPLLQSPWRRKNRYTVRCCHLVAETVQGRLREKGLDVHLPGPEWHCPGRRRTLGPFLPWVSHLRKNQSPDLGPPSCGRGGEVLPRSRQARMPLHSDFGFGWVGGRKEGHSADWRGGRRGTCLGEHGSEGPCPVPLENQSGGGGSPSPAPVRDACPHLGHWRAELRRDFGSPGGGSR